MAHQNQIPALCQHMLDRRQGLHNTVVIRNILRLVERHIKVHPHQHFFAFYIDIRNSLFCHKNSFQPILLLKR